MGVLDWFNAYLTVCSLRLPQIRMPTVGAWADRRSLSSTRAM